MLENTVESGSGTAAQIENMTVAGKTGTTTSDFDRWFAGYTPYYTGVVWCGYDDPEEVVLTDSSANPATVLWQKVMAKVHEGLANKEFNKPTNVKLIPIGNDQATGRLSKIKPVIGWKTEADN